MKTSVLVAAGLVAAIAIVLLYRDRYSASNFEVVPDSVEYALAGHRLATEGRYAIVVAGRDLPPRYPPWFSLLVAVPAYVVLGPEPGNAIFPVTALAVCGVLIAFALGRRIGGAWGGALAALAVLSLPDYRLCGRVFLTDVPATVLLIAAGVVYLRLRRAQAAPTMDYLAAGLLLGVAASFRPVSAAAVLPFVLAALRSGSRARFTRLMLLLLPLGLGAAATFAYNAATFGSPSRSGYHFWCPVPYDYPALLLSASYIGPNLRTVWSTGLPLVAAAGLLLHAVWSRSGRLTGPPSRDARSTVEFLCLGTGPIVVAYLVYFFPDPRFFLPALVVSAILLGAMVGARLQLLPSAILLALLAALLLEAAVVRLRRPEPPPERRLAADRIAASTPGDATVISAIEPAYLEYLVGRHSARRIVPLSRDVEYADKAIAVKAVADPVPAPMSWRDHRCPGLLARGAEEAIPVVAAEELDELDRQVREGRRIFVDTTAIRSSDDVLLRIRERFSLVPRGKDLFELAAR